MIVEALIIDDDEAFANVVEICLRGWQSRILITKATTLALARDCLEKRDRPFDLVILDQHLPDGLGVEISEHPKLQDSTVLAVSADDNPELPGKTVKAGAQHFLGKRQVTTPLFIPLVEALLERRKLERQLKENEINESRIQAIQVLLATLKHEINNPLGAVLGAAYLLRHGADLGPTKDEAINLIERSGNRIKYVLEQLCEAIELQEVSKASERVFHVPGDKPWPTKENGEDKNPKN